jgi:hypothetical protein
LVAVNFHSASMHGVADEDLAVFGVAQPVKKVAPASRAASGRKNFVFINGNRIKLRSAAVLKASRSNAKMLRLVCDPAALRQVLPDNLQF